MPRKNGRHALVSLLRQSVFGRLAGYEDANQEHMPGGLRPYAEKNQTSRLQECRFAVG